MKSLLTIKDLNAWYGNAHILKDISMHVNSGETVSIIGPNGAGKSTVLKSIMSLVGKKQGKILYHDENITNLKAHQLINENISFVPQGRIVFSHLTVQENLEMGAFSRPEKINDGLNDVYIRFPRLKERKSQKAGLLSGGEQQMLAIGRGLMIQPSLLIMDEPSLGLSPAIKKQIFKEIVSIQQSGMTVLLVEQNARMALMHSSRAYVLENGRNKLTGTGNQLLGDKRVQQMYLGGK